MKRLAAKSEVALDDREMDSRATCDLSGKFPIRVFSAAIQQIQYVFLIHSKASNSPSCKELPHGESRAHAHAGVRFRPVANKIIFFACRFGRSKERERIELGANELAA
ncbi:MAG: hypothetical protein ACXWXT_05275 [Candidatus Binatia bacterium]